MKIDHLYQIDFNWEELKQLLADNIEFEANDTPVSDPKYKRLLAIAAKAREEHSCVEVSETGVTLVVDGVAYSEEIPRK